MGVPGDATRIRVFIAGRGPLLFAGEARFAGVFHAPHAELVTQQSFELFGSLSVRRLAPGAGLIVEHDAALRAVFAECSAPR
jgi:hypothetical protein